MLKPEVVGSLQHGKGKVLKARSLEWYTFTWTVVNIYNILENRNIDLEISLELEHSELLGSLGAALTTKGAEIAAAHAFVPRLILLDSYAIKIIDKTHPQFDLPSLEKEIMILKKV